MITTVFIDIDNTLLDFDVCATYAMSKGLEKYGKHYENGLFECFKKINDNLWRRIEDGTLTKDGLKKNQVESGFRRVRDKGHRRARV